MAGNFVKIDRGILDWGWWEDMNTFRLFFYMIVKANWKDGHFKGVPIQRGSFASSVGKLADGTNLTVDEVRTALKHLKSTNEINCEAHSKFTIFTVVNYNEYQGSPNKNQNVPEQIPSSSQAETSEFPNSTQAETLDFTGFPDEYPEGFPLTSQTETDEIPESSQGIAENFPTIEEYIEEEKKEEWEEENKEAEIEKKENDKGKGKGEGEINNTTAPPEDIQTVIQSWNTLSEYNIPPVYGLVKGGKKYELLSKIILEHGVDGVLKAIDNIKTSDFLQGKNNRGWIIQFGWFIRPDKFPNVLEGDYNDSPADTAYSSRDDPGYTILTYPDGLWCLQLGRGYA